MWVKLREDLLDQRLCQVEACQGLLSVQEGAELVVLELRVGTGGILEAFVDSGVLLGQYQTDLLDHRELPVEGARVVKATTQRLCHI